jgi:CRP/FNR family transcriptional regulator, cyclic AMP receptor protein
MTSANQHNTHSSCETCTLKQNDFLCHLSPLAAKEFESIKMSYRYPEGSILFLENERARGVFLVCSGKVKLSVSSRAGKNLILQIVQPGEVIGLSASMSGAPYEVTAETLHPAQVVFISREDFLRFVHRFPEAYGAVTQQLNLQYARACAQLRTIGLSTTAHEKLARLFLNWPSDEKRSPETNQIKVPLTHEQIAACVGSTRETVTRTLSDFKNKHLVTLKGTTVMISDRSALVAMSGE